jgi:hypothetical protein
MNVHINASTHIIFLKLQDKPHTTIHEFHRKWKIPVCTTCMGNLYCPTHFHESFYPSFLVTESSNLSRVYTSDHHVYIYIKHVLPPFWTSCTYWRYLGILCWIPRHISAQIQCCLFLCLNYRHQKVILFRIMTVMYFTTSNSISFL